VLRIFCSSLFKFFVEHTNTDTTIMEMVIIMAVEVLLLFVAMGLGLLWEQE